MPGAADAFANHEAVRERPVIMAAMGIDRENLGSGADQQNILMATGSRIEKGFYLRLRPVDSEPGLFQLWALEHHAMEDIVTNKQLEYERRTEELFSSITGPGTRSS